MHELPLFPLNTVLFPGMPLPLHIFEDRYKAMIQFCLQENQPFGVVLIKEGVAEGGPLARPHLIGCTAEIAQVENLDEGRLLIMSIGRERFRVTRLQYEKPYLVGLVETAPIIQDDPDLLRSESAELFPLVREYLDILSRSNSVDFDAAQIPTEAIPLGYLAATIIQLPAAEKQELLAMDRATELLYSTLRVFRREVKLMQTMPSNDQGIFSEN
ncbi:MAG: LON peptidase substrate-binding domain-containing protein [Chloroflexota bacterium]